MTKYNGEVLEQYASSLYKKAEISMVLHTITGIVLGAAIGYLPMIVWYWRQNHNTPPNTNISMGIGVVLGATIFGLVGNAKAFKYRLLAQTTLCQVQIERNTRLN